MVASDQAATRVGVSAGTGADGDATVGAGVGMWRRAVDSLTPAFAAICATVAPGILAAARATRSADSGLRVTRFVGAGVTAGVASSAGAGVGCGALTVASTGAATTA